GNVFHRDAQTGDTRID
ncbi:hypothetical protein D046_8356B, partial [Vibrio parahaemolyticus V-223/04]